MSKLTPNEIEIIKSDARKAGIVFIVIIIISVIALLGYQIFK